jgi:DNA-binding NarL/FixJ family response regulator
MHASVLVVGHDDDCLGATRDALTFGRLVNPVVALADLADLDDFLHARAPYTPRTHHPVPAVVVTELHLPSGTAVDVLRVVRATVSLRRVPVIVVSDRATSAEIAAITAAGATSYLDRGVAADVLVGVLRDADLPWALARPVAGIGA